MTIPAISIWNVPPAKIANLLAELKADRSNAVATPAPNNYSVMGHGITVAVVYAPETSRLLVQVVQKPWYVSVEMIHDQLVKALG